MKSSMFVIRKAHSNQWWQCSAEHGCGWHPNYPKQAFSRSQLTAEIRRMIDEGFFCAITIYELTIPMPEQQQVTP